MRGFTTEPQSTPRKTETLAGKTDGSEVFLLQAQVVGGAAGCGIVVEDTGGDLGGGVIRNVALLSAGMAYPAIGVPFEIDAVMLQQARDGVNATPEGVRSRISHPELADGPFGGMTDGIFYLVGRAKNARVENGQLRGDMHIGDYANNGPQGKVGSFLLGVARRDPSSMFISLRYVKAGYVQRDGAPPLGRVAAVLSADFVGQGGSNPGGLLAGKGGDRGSGVGDREKGTNGSGDGTSGKNLQGGKVMKLNAKQRAYLASCGISLAADATAEQITAALAGLNKLQQTYVESLAGDDAGAGGGAAAGNLAGNGQATQGQAGQAQAGQGQQSQVDLATRDGIATEAVNADRKRVTDIMALAKGPDGQDRPGITVEWLTGLANRGVSLAEVQKLVELAATMRPVASPASSWVGPDRKAEMLRSAVGDAICLRGGVPLYEFSAGGLAVRDPDGKPKARKPHEQAGRFAALSFVRTAAAVLSQAGVPGVGEMGDGEILDLAMNQRAFVDRFGGHAYLAMSTSDLPSVLGNTMRNTIRAYFADAETAAIYPRWTARMPLPDYRTMDVSWVSEMPDLLLQSEGSDVRFATFTDGHETIRVFRFSRGVSFTKQAQRNDTFGVFARQVRNFAMAPIRLLDRVTTAIITANAALSDTGLLLNATAQTTPGGHANLLNPQVALSIATANAWAASAAALSAGRTALSTRLGARTAEDGDNGPAILPLLAKFILVSAAVADTCRSLINPAALSIAGISLADQVKGLVAVEQVIANPYLDAAGRTAHWTIGADPEGPGGGVAHALLQGEEGPQTRSEVNFRSGDFETIMEQAAGAAATDFRGLWCGHV